jgi:hypothetical protein
MKPVLFGVIFILAYGLFSMKSHAAEEMSTGNAVFAGSGRY